MSMTEFLSEKCLLLRPPSLVFGTSNYVLTWTWPLLISARLRGCSCNLPPRVYSLEQVAIPRYSCKLPQTMYSLERVALSWFLHGSEDVLVDPEADGDGETREREVRGHTEHGEHGERQQHQHHAAEHHAALLHICPVDQVQNYREQQNNSAGRLVSFINTAMFDQLWRIIVQGHEANIKILRSGNWSSSLFCQVYGQKTPTKWVRSPHPPSWLSLQYSHLIFTTDLHSYTRAPH